MLEQRLDAVAQSHMVSAWCGCQRRNAKRGDAAGMLVPVTTSNRR